MGPSVVGVILGVTRIPREGIGAVRLLAHTTLVDVADEAANRVLKKLNGITFKGRKLDEFPTDVEILQQCRPIYETHPGWMVDTSSVNRYAALPANARRYLERLSELIETDISIISTGPDRAETIMPSENSKLRKLLLTA